MAVTFGVEFVSQVIDRESCFVGRKVVDFDRETGKATIGEVIATKKSDGGRLEAQVRYEDGITVWLPTYVCRDR